MGGKAMRLTVKQGERTVNEFHFDKGPVYIGRHANSQVFLPDKTVSRQHAVIYNTKDGQWVVEDLDSANKTYLNENEIHKAEVKTGDVVRISDFAIEVNFETDAAPDPGETVELEEAPATLITGPQIIIRKLGAEKAPAIRFQAERATDFLYAIEELKKADNLDRALLVLLELVSKQFKTYQVWGAMRAQAGGPMTSHAGRNRSGMSVEQAELEFSDKIGEAIDKKQFMLFISPRDLSQQKETQIRSVIIAPLLTPAGCFGVIYANNTFRDDHYNLGDLDFLMLLGLHSASVLAKLPA
ncbi:MAG: FHA domain-containing protein [Sedimentisphaerales bacterium]|nr:FHA domain-containing protein [Sedimentisphaerales bacterium]